MYYTQIGRNIPVVTTEPIFFTDVPQTYWALYEIAEASNAHNSIRLEDGGEKRILDDSSDDE